MTAGHDVDVAIVGGGLGGLTLAVGLLRRGVPVAVFEQTPEHRDVGAGIALGGNATRLLRLLGVDLAAAANVPPALEFRRWHDGALLWSHPIGDWYLDRMGAPYHMLNRSTLRRHLAAQVPAERIHFGHRLVAVRQGVDEVRLTFDGAGEDRCVRARLVVGFDGVHSVTRAHAAPGARPVYSGEIGFRGVIASSTVPALPNPNALQAWCGPRTHVICYGVDDGSEVNLLAVHVPDRLPEWTRQTNRVPGTRAEAERIFADYGWDQAVLDLVRHIDGDMNFWALLDLPRIDTWSRGRVVLAGDAVHAPLPHQGQGAGQAIEDAYVLAELLAAHGREDYRRAFDAYQRFRRARAFRIQLYSRLAGRFYKLTGEAAARRDAALPRVPDLIGWMHAYRTEEELARA